jgi:hypothetical protein
MLLCTPIIPTVVRHDGEEIRETNDYQLQEV